MLNSIQIFFKKEILPRLFISKPFYMTFFGGARNNKKLEPFLINFSRTLSWQLVLTMSYSTCKKTKKVTYSQCGLLFYKLFPCGAKPWSPTLRFFTCKMELRLKQRSCRAEQRPHRPRGLQSLMPNNYSAKKDKKGGLGVSLRE